MMASRENPAGGVPLTDLLESPAAPAISVRATRKAFEDCCRNEARASR